MERGGAREEGRQGGRWKQVTEASTVAQRLQ